MQYADLAAHAAAYITYHDSPKFQAVTLEGCKKFFSPLLPFFVEKDFNIDTFREYLASKKGGENSSINNYIKNCRSFLNWLERNKKITHDENFKEMLSDDILPTEQAQNVPSREVLKQIVDAIASKRFYTVNSKIPEEIIDKEYIPAFKLMFYTGIRSGAFASIKGSDILPFANRPVFYFRNKGGKRRELPIPPQMQEDMRERAGRGDMPAYQFNTPHYQDIFNSILKRTVTLLGIKGLEMKSHFFRHSYISHLLNNTNAKPQDVMKLVCHSRLDTTMIYFHEDINHLSDVVMDNIGIENPELMKKDQFRNSLIDRIVGLGIERWRINCEGTKVVLNLEGKG